MASNDNPPSGTKSKWRGWRLALLLILIILVLLDAALLIYQHHAHHKSPAIPAPQESQAPQAATPAASPVPPSFDIVRVNMQGDAVLAGRAEPGALVTVKDGDDIIGTVTADSQGEFVLLPTAPLALGMHEITLSETLKDGRVIKGLQSVSVDVPGNGKPPLAVVSGPNGSQVVTGQGPQAGQLGMGAVDYDMHGHAIFSGTAPAGARVTITLGGQTLGQVVADADGRWHLSASAPDAPGILTLNAVTAAGVALPPVGVPFAPEELITALKDGHVVIQPGDNLWMIARKVYGHGIMYTLIYSANASKIHNPNLIFPGQDFVLPKK